MAILEGWGARQRFTSRGVMDAYALDDKGLDMISPRCASGGTV